MKKYILLVSLLLSALPAYAAEDKKLIKQEFERAFQQMLQKPDNLDLTMRYAELAIKLEDYEAAIPAFERILMFNPELLKVRLQLGIMYYRLRSFDMAKTYFLTVKEGKNVSAELRTEAESYLKKIDQK